MGMVLLDIKRVFSGKSTALLCVLSPIIVMLIFSTLIAPLIYVSRLTTFRVAICREDPAEAVTIFINQMVNSQALKDLISVYPAATLQQGQGMLARGDVAVLIHVPPDFMQNMEQNQPSRIDIYGGAGHQLEAGILKETLGSSLEIVSRGGNLIGYVSTYVVEKGVPRESGGAVYDRLMKFAVGKYMNRREVVGDKGVVSLFQEYLPLHYYLSAIFTLFAALGMVPLVRFTVKDLNGPVIKRGLFFQRSAMFGAARLISGSVFIMLILFLALPTGLVTSALKDIFISNYAALLGAIVLSAFCFSAISMAIAACVRREETALWTAFWLVILMAITGGALIPFGVLPNWISAIGQWLPIRPAMNALAGGFFKFDPGQYLQDMVKLAAWGTAAVAVVWSRIYYQVKRL